MKRRRELKVVAYLSESAVVTVDKLIEKGQIDQLFALFMENISEVLDMHNGKKYVTQEEMVIMQEKILETMTALANKTESIGRDIKADRVSTTLDATPLSVNPADFMVAIDMTEPIETQAFGDAPEVEDDPFAFNIT